MARGKELSPGEQAILLTFGPRFAGRSVSKAQLFLRKEVQALMSSTELAVPVSRSDTIRPFKVLFTLPGPRPHPPH